jgi:hypothetical protein
MSFTLILALFALLGLAVVFGVTYKIKGLKAAFIATGIALLVFSTLYVVIIYAIVNAMSFTSRVEAGMSKPASVTDIQSRFFIVVSDVYIDTFESMTPLPQNGMLFPASLDEAETLAGFKILEPAFLPDGYVLVSIDYSAEDRHVGLLYYKDSQSRQVVYFLQQRTAFSEHQSIIGTSALIQKLQVNDVPAEYVQGGFDDAGSTSTVDRLRWNPLRDLGRFRWEKDNYYFQISTGRDIDSATLRHMAESLKQHMVTPNATPLPTLMFEETPLSSISLTPALEETEVLNMPTSSINTTYPLLKTSMGEFVIVSARLVEEVHGDKSPIGEKFLLVVLAQPNLEKLIPGEFSLESFQNMVNDSHGEIYILGNDGSRKFSTGMGGWVEDEFVMGFTVPVVETYTLYWPGNLPIYLEIEE